MTTPEPRPIDEREGESRTVSARPSARALRRLQDEDRGGDVDRRGEPERQSVADEADA